MRSQLTLAAAFAAEPPLIVVSSSPAIVKLRSTKGNAEICDATVPRMGW